MMREVTQIREKDSSRSRVCLDNEEWLVLYKGEIRKYHIRVGEGIPEEVYRELLEVVLPLRAKKRCLNLLKSRDYTRSRLSDKLREGEYPETVITQALEYVASYGYIDDERYAESYIRTMAGSRSRRRMEQELLQKGIERSVITRAFEAWEDEGGGQDQRAMIMKLLDKRHFDPACADDKERNRNIAYLMRQGYSSDIIFDIVKER